MEVESVRWYMDLDEGGEDGGGDGGGDVGRRVTCDPVGWETTVYIERWGRVYGNWRVRVRIAMVRAEEGGDEANVCGGVDVEGGRV